MHILRTRWNHPLSIVSLVGSLKKSFKLGLSDTIDVHINRPCKHQTFCPLSFVKHPPNILLIQSNSTDEALSSVSKQNRPLFCAVIWHRQHPQRPAFRRVYQSSSKERSQQQGPRKKALKILYHSQFSVCDWVKGQLHDRLAPCATIFTPVGWQTVISYCSVVSSTQCAEYIPYKVSF